MDTQSWIGPEAFRKAYPGDFFRLRQSGLSRRDAARTLGIRRTTAAEWDTGIRRTQNGRIYPNGQAVDYNKGVTTTIPASGNGMVPLPALEQAIDERYLSIKEREAIRDMLQAGTSQRKIAEAMGRSASTISREIARNSVPDRGYQPYAAHRAAASRRPRPKDSKLAVEGQLRKYVKEKLAIRWSPEQISHTLVEDFPDDTEMRVPRDDLPTPVPPSPRRTQTRDPGSPAQRPDPPQTPQNRRATRTPVR